MLELAASFGLLATLGGAPASTVVREGVVGAWSLVTFDVDERTGSRKPRFGPDPIGYLIYSADMRMAAVLAGTHRPELKSPSGSAASEAQRSESLLNFSRTPDVMKCAATESSITWRSASLRTSSERRSSGSSK